MNNFVHVISVWRCFGGGGGYGGCRTLLYDIAVIVSVATVFERGLQLSV